MCLTISRTIQSSAARFGVISAVLLALFYAAAPASAQEAEAPQVAPDRCLALAQYREPQPLDGLIWKAATRVASLQPYQVRVTFLGHATMLIESAKGVKAATDYAVPIAAPETPDIVTMNNSHTSHFTHSPQPEITHVLRGWADETGARLHDVSVQDMRVRNVPTNVRDWGGGTRLYGNSIFVFEVGGLCMAHLGHLHHTLSPQQLANIGQMDVVFPPVDGSYTLDHAGLFEVLAAMNPRYIIPVHYFSRFTLDRFLSRARDKYKITELTTPTTVISKDNLPAETEVLVLPSRYGHSIGFGND